MPIILPSSVKKARKNTRKARGIKSPRPVRKRYTDALLQLTQILKDNNLKVSELFMSTNDQVRVMEFSRQLYKQAQQEFDDASQALANSYVSDLDQTHKTRYQNMIKGALGVDFATMIDDEGLRGVLNKSIAENVDLIESIPKLHHDRVTKAVRDHFDGNLSQGLPARLKEIGGMSDTKARFIARDQTASIVGALSESRSKEVGIKSYNWRNSQDRRVVGNPSGLYPRGNRRHMDHWHREGKEFAYDKPPKDGNPGRAINCRCYDEPVIKINELNAVYV